MKQSISVKLGQQLTMTPALQQAIKLLQMSTLDLKQEIEQALESNLMLERADEEVLDDLSANDTETSEADEGLADDIPEELPVDADWDELYPAPPSSGGPSDELRDFLQASIHTTPSLHEHLSWQASITSLDDEQQRIAVWIIDAVNDDGHLEDWPTLSERIAQELGADQSAIDATLQIVQTFDPPGVAARDVCECLELQLRQLPPETEGLDCARQLIDKTCLDLLAAGDLNKLQSRLDRDQAEVSRGIALLQSLQPHPGSEFQRHETQYVVPEVIVSRHENRWQVALNSEIAPRLRINPKYLALIKRADKSSEQATIKEHLQEARNLLNSLRSRHETLLLVAQCIVEEQRAFLEYGDEAMKPLVLRDVAESIGVHESTVSRATSNKYMLTPRGLYELKYFFSSHVPTTDGGVCSATAIQAMIKRLVAEETDADPLSDSKLAEMLLENGVKVARRTVAKYREGMNIPPSHERRRLARIQQQDTTAAGA